MKAQIELSTEELSKIIYEYFEHKKVSVTGVTFKIDPGYKDRPGDIAKPELKGAKVNVDLGDILDAEND